MMQRAGTLKYSVDIGKYNVDGARRKPNFAQASAFTACHITYPLMEVS